MIPQSSLSLPSQKENSIGVPSRKENSAGVPPQKENSIAARRSEVEGLLALSILFSCLLVFVHVILIRKGTYLSLVWNLFLAYVPYFISSCLSRRPQWIARKSLLVAVFLAWLVCIPNSFYIITDLFHLADHAGGSLIADRVGGGLAARSALNATGGRQAPQWLDLAMILSFAWNGLLLGVLSLRQMEKIMLPLLPARHELFFLYPILWLNALGIYIGRYLRYNTWDVITNPFQLFGDIARMIAHPLRNQYAWDMIFCYSILLTLMYLMLKRISKALA